MAEHLDEHQSLLYSVQRLHCYSTGTSCQLIQSSLSDEPWDHIKVDFDGPILRNMWMLHGDGRLLNVAQGRLYVKVTEYGDHHYEARHYLHRVGFSRDTCLG